MADVVIVKIRATDIIRVIVHWQKHMYFLSLSVGSTSLVPAVAP